MPNIVGLWLFFLIFTPCKNSCLLCLLCYLCAVMATFMNKLALMYCDKPISLMLKKARRESGLSVKELSEKIGLAVGTIYKLEQGRGNPSGLRYLPRIVTWLSACGYSLHITCVKYDGAGEDAVKVFQESRNEYLSSLQEQGNKEI